MSHRGLLAWLDNPPNGRGIHFALDGEGWDRWSYADLARRTHLFARGLCEAGVQPGDRVAIILRSGPDFVGVLFGAMLAGAIPCPIAPPMLFQEADAYASHLAAILAGAQPAVVIASAELVARLTRHFPQIEVTTVEQLVATVTAGSPPAVKAPADLALLQFTSGSSGRPRGVRIPFSSLEANVHAIRQWLGMTADDATATWLPVHHDMGLIGCLVTPIVNGSDLWVLDPERFLRQPLRYLRCFSGSGARLTAMPAFGLDHVVRRVRPASLAGFDLTGWRALIVGAERIDPATLERFHTLLAPYGFRRQTFRPAYGLAEATLAVTGLALEDTWRTVGVHARTLALGQPVSAIPEGDTIGQAVVGCGRPLAGVEIDIVDEDGTALAEGRLGQIVVRGPSVGAGYATAEDSPSRTALAEGTLHTGDAGFVVDGQLFVLGRLGDSMKVRGRTVFAEDIEAALVHAGIPRDRVAVLLGSSASGAVAVALVERAEEPWLAITQSVLRRAAEGATISVVAVPRNTIDRTTSGKPKRRPLWRSFTEGRLPTARPRPDTPIPV